MRHHAFVRGLVVASTLTGIALVACSGDDGAASISPEAACDDFSKTLCAKIEQCAPFFLDISYGDTATCEQRVKINCVPGLSANGTSRTPSELSQCATDAKAISCEDALARKLPASCRTEPGALADGAACGVDDQCKGRLCRLSSGNVCGACSVLGTGGAACERNEDCESELGCADKKCVAFAKAGSPCSATQPCLPTLACNKGTCAAPLAAGSACEPTLDLSQNPCDGAKGLYCHGGTKVCTAFTFAGPGSPCGFIDGGLVGCTGGGNCKLSPGTAKGVCQAPAADGAPCNDIEGPKCLAPARCVGGVCKISDPSSCK